MMMNCHPCLLTPACPFPLSCDFEVFASRPPFFPPAPVHHAFYLPLLCFTPLLSLIYFCVSLECRLLVFPGFLMRAFGAARLRRDGGRFPLGSASFS